MSKEGKTKAKITLERDMIFKCDMGDMKLKDCYIDETNVNEEDMLGPKPTRLLANAILGCLSASFIFCLKKKESYHRRFNSRSRSNNRKKGERFFKNNKN